MRPSIVEGVPLKVSFRAHPMFNDDASAAPNMPWPMLFFTRATFWFFSISIISSSVRELCHTTHNCSVIVTGTPNC